MSGANGEPKTGGVGTENTLPDPSEVPDPSAANGANQAPAPPTDRITADQIVCGGFQFTSTRRREAAKLANPNPQGTFY
jgi:hypothetical protein